MIYNVKTWPYKWFGFWKEYGEQYSNYPSVFDFIDKMTNDGYEKAKLVKYLKNGLVLTTTSQSAFPFPIDAEIRKGSISIRTDGQWLWLDNICDLIEFNNLVIPDVFYELIETREFIVPEIKSEHLEILEWPSL